MLETNVQQLFDTARKAADEFHTFRKEQIEKILRHVGEKASERSEYYAKWAVEETGCGDIESKIAKNYGNSMGMLNILNVSDLVEPSFDEEKKIISFPKPAGIVVALVPATSPVATVYNQVMLILATRNVVILCPHPSAKNCGIDSAKFCAKLAEEAGAPKGCIQVLEEISSQLVDTLMRAKETNFILATGGQNKVRAAYSSGTPSIGVGPGNAPAYVDDCADVEITAEMLVKSVAYDNGLICTSESAVVAHATIADDLLSAFERAGAQVCTEEQVEILRNYLYPDGKINPNAIGKSAQYICEHAKIPYQNASKILLMPAESAGQHEVLSKEKLFPCLTFFRVKNSNEGVTAALAMLNITGRGHSVVVHSKNPEVAIKFGAAMPVCRISVNCPGLTGSSGVDTNLAYGAIIGTGFFGGSSVDFNVGASELVQYTRLAYNKASDLDTHNIVGVLNEENSDIQ